MKNSKVVRLVAGLLLLCILLTACAKGGEGTVPDEVQGVYTAYLEDRKTDNVAAASHCLFRKEEYKKLTEESKEYLSEYRIEGWKQLGNELWAVDVWINGDYLVEGKSITHFVGKVNGKYCVMLNARSIPRELTVGVEIEKYYDPDDLDDSIIGDTPINIGG